MQAKHRSDMFFLTGWIILNRRYPTYSPLGDPTTWNTWWMTTFWNHHLTWWTNNMIESLQRWSTTKINPGFFWNSFRSSRPCGKALRSRKRDFSMRSSFISGFIKCKLNIDFAWFCLIFEFCYSPFILKPDVKHHMASYGSVISEVDND